MIFLNDKNFVFCSLSCDTCPVKFICFTTKASGFNIQYNEDDWYVDYYYDDVECKKQYFRCMNKIVEQSKEK